VTALQAAGVKCVIARSFAFIYGRNQPNLGLLGFEMEDDKFWSLVEDGQDISVDLDKLMVTVGGRDGESFPFKLSMMQRRLFEVGGIAKAFGRWGKALWDSLTATTPRTAVAAKMSGPTVQSIEKKGSESKMEW
jgi:3-isopropylmalate dehydratase small subunit